MAAKKKPTETPPTAPELVTVEVIQQPIYENDAHHVKGARFQTTPARAAGLAALVKIVP